MRNVSWWLLGLAIVVIGCGGTGGGGTTDTGSTATTSTTATTATTATTSTSSGGTGSTATVIGRVTSDSGVGLPGVKINFYAGTTVTATVTTDSQGSFRYGISPSSTRFHLQSSTISPVFYPLYLYNGEYYAASLATCTAPLPSLTPNGTTNLPSTIRIPSTQGPPPPPPTGCN